MAAPARHQVTVLGFTDRVPALLQAADLVVTKPGGLISSEALASGTPMLITDPTPGEEQQNKDYLLENGAAAVAQNLETLAFKIDRLLESPENLESIGVNARRLARPLAAESIARFALEWLSNAKSSARANSR